MAQLIDQKQVKDLPALATAFSSRADIRTIGTGLVLQNGTLRATGGGGSGGVSQEYVDERDQSVLAAAKTYADQAAADNFTTADRTKLNSIQVGAEVNVQSDFNQTNSAADDFIKNKPTVPVITMTNVDPGVGSALEANHYIFVYE